MPLKETSFGQVCPIDKFTIESYGGAYTADPVETCLECNFADLSVKRFDLNKICTCPVNLTLDQYTVLQRQYSSISHDLTRTGFQNYVKENFK